MESAKEIQIAMLKETFHIQASTKQYVVALAGNPNVGKSTIFNELTGLRQHTGNWPGKTVDNAQGIFTYFDQEFLLIDLPGTYSILSHSPEEEIARDFICKGMPDVTLVVVDASCLERNLNLALQVIEITDTVVVCVNLIDEATRKGITINIDRLSEELGVPVIGTTARTGDGLDELKELLMQTASGIIKPTPKRVQYPKQPNNLPPTEETIVTTIYKTAESIAKSTIHQTPLQKKSLDYRLDDIFTSRLFGYPIMLFLLSGIFYLTIEGANIPSSMLASLFSTIEEHLIKFSSYLGMPDWLQNLLILGIYRSTAWVISVMLPPMAIFFPLFTFLEDLGYLPRIAFNLDNAFKKCHACGKQALTICMGFGCNAAGVISCRIISSPRERLIAILTNAFTPCNGKFPSLILFSTVFLIPYFPTQYAALSTALIITATILLGILITFFASWLLSHTFLKGQPSTNILELPPYRIPQIGSILYRSIIDRTIFVLKRAILMAAPAGAIIWCLGNITIDHINLIHICAAYLQPFANSLGLDGIILLAFILGLPANEIVVPIILMSYLATGQMVEVDTIANLQNLLLENGWTLLTAMNTMLFFLFHWPCTTTLFTIYKESGSKKWTLLAFLLPTLIGFTLCFITASIARNLGFA